MKTDPSDARWFKSRHSGPSRDCVEVAGLGSGEIGVRDSKNPTGPVLVFPRSAWQKFLSSARRGAFDHS
ncbi:DUF397 domain-containing protein [Nocardia flavorosea]|uniref:DUF397 domain-containing protein n=1 Tax=Nocardia flavorosea TaxID=53429 RepID=A0A846Y956_9NOCA|nr:DUF397 domain-containing protein [Nocardia flavorosea]NKY55693.1 DUF397 domain-containing protein [Nocardia flavorosea]